MRAFRKGQMSLIMILVLAVALVFYGISSNIARLTAMKTQVTMASNMGAATLGSMVLSYAESLKQTSLEGGMSKKQAPKWIKSIIRIFESIVFIVVGFFFDQSLMLNGITGLAANALALSVGVFTDAKQTKAWNKMQAAITEPGDRAVETGVQTMLSASVSDQVTVPDMYDLDMNGLWWNPANGTGNDKNETMSRYAYYYGDRLVNASAYPDPDIAALLSFLKKLKAKLALSEPLTMCYRDVVGRTGEDPRCNACCNWTSYRPATCSQDLIPAECLGLPGCSESSLQSCYVYDATYAQNMAADENKLMPVFAKDDGNSKEMFVQNIATNDPKAIFRGADSAGKFFPLLWLLNDTKPFVNNVRAASTTPASPECHWCASQLTACTPETGTQALYRPPGNAAYAQLALPDGCSGDDCCIDQFLSDTPGTMDPRQIDAVRGIDWFAPVADSSLCPYPAPGQPLYWKRGADIDSETFEYWSPMTLHRTEYQIKMAKPDNNPSNPKEPVLACNEDFSNPAVSCVCSANEINKTLWSDDSFDEISNQLHELADIIQQIIDTEANQGLSWVQSQKSSWAPLLQSASDIVGQKGIDRFSQITPKIDDWLSASYADDTMWCVPNNKAGMTQKEITAVGKNTTWGSLDSVIQCLDYNSDNVTAFQGCSGFCQAAIQDGNGGGNDGGSVPVGTCTDLPRSLVKDFDPNNDPGKQGCSAEYRTKIAQSAVLAKNQVEKFKKRSAYLKDLRQRATEVKTGLNDAVTYLSNVPDPRDPSKPSGLNAQEMINKYLDVILFENVCDTSDPNMPDKCKTVTLGNEVIYGWYSPRPANVASGQRGYLHLIKVSAAVPSHGSKNGQGDPKGLPTYTNILPQLSEGKHHVYSLTGYKGCAGARVVRYDEDHDEGRGGVVKFLSGLPLWKILYHNPFSSVDVAWEKGQIQQACFDTHYKKVTTTTGGTPSIQYLSVPRFTGELAPLEDAFMIDLPIDNGMGTGTAVATCRNTAEKLLQAGVVSQTCVFYTYVNGQPKMQFKPCNECANYN